MSNFVHLNKPRPLTEQILVGILFFALSAHVAFLEASQISTRQDIGATVRIEKTEKEQNAMMKRLARKKKKVEIKGEEALQPKRPAVHL